MTWKKTCEALGCQSTQGPATITSCTMFAFPRDPLRRKQWEKCIQMKNSGKAKRFLCSRHFSQDAFLNSLCRKLKNYAVPSKQDGPLMRQIDVSTLPEKLVNDPNMACSNSAEIEEDAFNNRSLHPEKRKFSQIIGNEVELINAASSAKKHKQDELPFRSKLGATVNKSCCEPKRKLSNVHEQMVTKFSVSQNWKEQDNNRQCFTDTKCKSKNIVLSCSAEGCTNNNENCDLSFFPVPLKSDSRSCSRGTQLGNINLSERFLCHKHFQEEIFTDSFRKQLQFCFSDLPLNNTNENSVEKCQTSNGSHCNENRSDEIETTALFEDEGDELGLPVEKKNSASDGDTVLDGNAKVRTVDVKVEIDEVNSHVTSDMNLQILSESSVLFDSTNNSDFNEGILKNRRDEKLQLLKALLMEQQDHVKRSEEIDKKLIDAMENVNKNQIAAYELKKKINGLLEQVINVYG